MSKMRFLSALLTASFISHTFAANIWEDSPSRSSSATRSIDIDALNNAFVNVAEKASPAVVLIETSTTLGGQRGPRGGRQGRNLNDPNEIFRYFFNPFGSPNYMPPQESRSLGSGFVINSEEGLIVTNAHVIRMNNRFVDEVKVKFIGEENSRGFDVDIVGADDETEVAVLRLKRKPKKLQSIALGDSSKLKVGEWVVAIGNPYGRSFSVTKGIVSALGRNIDPSLRSDFIQTDASINQGNSGGPLLNLYGEVIGINTAIDARAQGIGFAIPINVAKNIIDQLVRKGQVTRGWLGVDIDNVDEKVAEALGLKEPLRGALIKEVVKGSPAAKGGLQSYDVVTEFAGQKVNGAHELRMLAGNTPIGKSVTYKAIREGREISGQIIIGKRPSEMQVASSPSAPNKKSESSEAFHKELGMRLSPLNAQMLRQLGLEEGTTGVLVEEVEPYGIAAEASLEPGDVILEVNRRSIKNVKEAESLLLSSKNSVLLKIRRQGGVMVVLLEKK